MVISVWHEISENRKKKQNTECNEINIEKEKEIRLKAQFHQRNRSHFQEMIAHYFV